MDAAALHVEAAQTHRGSKSISRPHLNRSPVILSYAFT